MTQPVSNVDQVRALHWHGDHLLVLDQRQLPFAEHWLACRDAAEVAAAIRDLAVRGAPAIGIAAAYGVVLAARQTDTPTRAALQPALDLLRAARPTAVNLSWALQCMEGCLDRGASTAQLEAQAQRIEAEDLAANRRMGGLGAQLLAPGSTVVTHCNTGSLATAGFGTALGVIRAAYAQGKIERVYHTETRPWLQGARLTAWELQRDGIPAHLIADSAVAHLMATQRVHWLIVGADRICANGDVANKIGTALFAVAARHYGCRVMVVAPCSTIDLGTPCGSGIEIELRSPQELLAHAGHPVAASGIAAWNPVFDVTPAACIDAIVTERGIIEAPDARRVAAIFAASTGPAAASDACSS